MTERAQPPTTDPPPATAAHRAHRSRIPLVWVVPAVAAIIGGWLIVHTLLARGPTITVTFLDGEGVEAGKTRLRCQSVDIGVVQAVTLAPNRRTVDVTVETAGFAAPFFVTSARFWIVRPRLGASGVSGLGTLISGPFIAMDIGHSQRSARHFTGLETPPAVSGDAQGREFVLDSTEVGSVGVSAPVYLHHIEVGRVSAVALNSDGRGTTLKVFVEAPYDRFVTDDARFWNASGVDVQVNSEGIHVQTESVSTILAGGIAFEPLPGSTLATPAREDMRFVLARDRSAALMPPDGVPESYVLNFSQSLRGLARGAAVDFRGITIGEVAAINIVYDRKAGRYEFPIRINIYPQRLQSRYANAASRPDLQSHALVARMISQGLRAQLRTASLVTGQRYIALDFFPHAPGVAAHPELTPMPLPTLPGDLDQLEASLVSVAQKLDRLPLERIGEDADGTLGSLNELLGQVSADVVPEAKSALGQARTTLLQTQQALSPDAALQTDLGNALKSIGRAADSLKILADYLDRHPEALIRGKTEDRK